MILYQQHSVLQLVPFIIEEQQYALPLPVVERVLLMVAVSPLPQAPGIALGVINFHGRVIPVLDIRRRLGFPACDYGLTTHLLIARTSQRTCALPVDEVWGVREVAAEAVVSPDAILPHLGHVAGIVVLADGLLVIQDLEALLSLEEEQRLAEVLEEMAR
jgi:purine-binding chemotaxis protein CheW